MKKPRKHAELIKQWADDDSLVIQNDKYEQWHEDPFPTWHEGVNYRIKPEVLRYRVGLFNAGTMSVDNEKEEKHYKNSRYFIKWLTDWIEVEI